MRVRVYLRLRMYVCIVYARTCKRNKATLSWLRLVCCRHEVPVTSEPITVIHMDEDVVVVNKPASIPVSGVLPELYCQKICLLYCLPNHTRLHAYTRIYIRILSTHYSRDRMLSCMNSPLDRLHVFITLYFPPAQFTFVISSLFIYSFIILIIYNYIIIIYIYIILYNIYTLTQHAYPEDVQRTS